MRFKSPVWNKTDLIFLLICAIYLYLHLFIIATPIFYEEDHLYFIQDAWRMYRGESIYRDFFEYTFPGTQLVYYGLLNLFGTKFWIINLVIFVQGFAQTLIALVISKYLFENKWISYLAPAIYLFFGFRWFGIDGTHRVLSPLFIGLAILVLFRERTPLRISLAGIFCALASYFTQQRGGYAVAAIGLFLLIEAIINKTGWKKFVTDSLILGISFAVALFLLILPFIISTGAQTFFDYTIVYIKYYVRDPTANYGAYTILLGKISELGILMTAISLFYYTLIPLVYFVAFFFLWRKKYQSGVLLVALVGCALALGTFAPTPGRFFQVCVPAIITLVWLISLIKFKSEIFVKTAVAFLVIFGLFLAFRVQTAWEKTYVDLPVGRVAFLTAIPSERYRWLLENAERGEYVFEVYQTAVNFSTQNPNPTQITFLLDNGYTPDWMVAKAIENLEDKKPRFIIWDGKFSKEKSERSPADPLHPLYEYLLAHYELRKEFTPYVGREMEAWQRK